MVYYFVSPSASETDASATEKVLVALPKLTRLELEPSASENIISSSIKHESIAKLGLRHMSQMHTFDCLRNFINLRELYLMCPLRYINDADMAAVCSDFDQLEKLEVFLDVVEDSAVGKFRIQPCCPKFQMNQVG